MVLNPRRSLKQRQARSKASKAGQAAVETMFMLPMFLLIFIGMYELFTVTFAAQNAHIRAREYLFHHGEYLPNSRVPNWENSGNKPGNPLFEGGEYAVARPDIWGVAGLVDAGPVDGAGLQGEFAAFAEDWAMDGIHESGGSQGLGAHLRADLVICSPYGCP